MISEGLGFLVSRETEEQLQEFAGLVQKWNRRINLIAGNEHDLWKRHILDSAQLFEWAPPAARHWVDLGTGGGFPGVVCAVLAKALGRATTFTFVESDARKCAFLREAARLLGLEVAIAERRIEAASLPPQDVVSARALAPLDRLLGYAYPFCHAGTRLLFPKGRQASSELTLARRHWHIRVVRIPSRTDPEGTIFQISEVMPRR